LKQAYDYWQDQPGYYSFSEEKDKEVLKKSSLTWLSVRVTGYSETDRKSGHLTMTEIHNYPTLNLQLLCFVLRRDKQIALDCR
jgi:hypothetical protein